jgi:hypothetical protein
MVDVRQSLAGRHRSFGDFEPWNALWSDAAHGVELSGRTVAWLLIGLLTAISIPIVMHPLPPLTDYINHLSRMYVISAIGTDPDLARFYEIHWQIIPNLMMDLIVPLLERFTNVFIAGQIYTIASFALILSGAVALNRQLFGRYSVLPLIAAPLLYNQVLLVGTMNYMSAIGVVLWSVTAWIWLRERPMPLRLIVSGCCVITLFFCHLYAVGVYGLALLAYELRRLLAPGAGAGAPYAGVRSWRRRIVEFFATGLPFLPVFALLMVSPTWGLRKEYFWQFDGKLDGLLFVIRLYFSLPAIVVVCIIAILGAGALYFRLLKIHAFGWMLLGVGAIVYLAMPRIIFDTYMADQRLPISLAFMIIACGHLDIRHAFVRRTFAATLVAVVALRICEVQAVWNDAAHTTDAFRESMRHIDRGSRILVAYDDPAADEDLWNQGLVHAACLAIIERSSLVTTAFTVVGKQILRTRASFRDIVDNDDGTPPSVGQLFEVANHPRRGLDAYWSDWTVDFDYVYFLFTRPDHRNPDPARLATQVIGDRFALYRILPPARPNTRPVEPADVLATHAGAQLVRLAPRPSIQRIRRHPLN